MIAVSKKDAQRKRMEIDQTAAEMMRWCCAACGPLSREDVGRFFAHKQAVPLKLKNGAYWELPSQPSLPTVKKKYEESAMLRQLCAAIMAQRTADTTNSLPEQLRCIAAARYALLVGATDEFRRLHRLYRGMPRIGVQPDSPRPEFWDAVLGPEWQGVELLPVGLAREEIYALRVSRYTLCAQPPELEPYMEKLPYILTLGWGLLRADLEHKPRPSGKEVSPSSRDEDVLLARAYWNLWAGSWENAYRVFHRLFRSSESHLISVADPHGGAVLLAACIAAIRAHAPDRTVAMWIGYARTLLLRALSGSDVEARADIAAFFDSLTLWDAVENRGRRHVNLPPETGPLAALPLAMGSRAIIRNTGVRLPVDRLVSDIRQVYDRGLKLLAFYAASSLEIASGVEPTALAPVRDIIEDCSFKPLYEKTGKRSTKATDEQWKHVISIVEHSRNNQRWLYWDLVTDHEGCILRVEPRVVERRPQATGKKVTLDDVQDPALLDCQDVKDMAVLTLARTLESKQLRGVPLVSEALVGHPRIRLVDGPYHRPMRVEGIRPVITAKVETFTLKLTLDVKQFTRVQVVADEPCLMLPTFNPRSQMLVDYFSNGPVTLNLTHTEQLRWFLSRLQEFFSIVGDVPDELMNLTPMKPLFVMHASVYDHGYLFDLDVLPYPEAPMHDIPGQGERVQLMKLPGGVQKCVVRDFEIEVNAARELAENCPTLHEAESEDYQWLLITPGEALQATFELNAAGVEVKWPTAAPPLQMVEPLQQSLRFTVRKQCDEWMEVDARLKVDEKQTLSLTRLMELYEQRSGNFLPLEEKRYLHLSPVLAEQMLRLSESLAKKGRRYVLPSVALPGFVEAWQGPSLPAPLLEYVALLESCAEAPAPRGITTELRDYQLEGYRWMLSRARMGLGVCLADDMGLGKTLQALALVVELAEQGPSLVVAPASLSSNWLMETAQYAPGLRVLTCAEVRNAPELPLQSGDLVVITYGQLTTHESVFVDVPWNLVVLDEAQAIKNPTSRRAEVACRLHARARVCLTGTPVENSLVDLWSLMQFMNPALPGSREFYAIAAAGKSDPSRVRRITAPFILRRKKEDVLPQLPPLTEIQLMTEFSDEERSIYESYRRKLRSRLRADREPAALLSEIMRLRRLCCHAGLVESSYTGESSKLRTMLRLVQELLSANHSVLIFSQFTDVLDLVEESLYTLQIPALRLDGGTPPKQRGAQVRLFQEGKAQVFLISLRAGGVGLNLTAADYVILLDPWWNPAVEAQAVSRSHRFGQNNPVTLCRLITRDTIEERILQMHDSKLALAESVVPEGIMPLAELRELLK